MEHPKTAMKRIKAFLEPTGVATETNTPILSQHYVDHFKLVDNFDQIMGYLQIPYKIEKVHFVWLIYLVLTATLNSWVLWNDYNQIGNIEDEKQNIYSFINSLVDQLLLE